MYIAIKSMYYPARRGTRLVHVLNISGLAPVTSSYLEYRLVPARGIIVIKEEHR